MRWLLKRWWFWAGAGFMLVAVCAGYLLIPVGEARISQAACDRIELGMSEAQVRNLLGDPLGTMWLWDERRNMYYDVFDWPDKDGNRILVTFFYPDRVTAKSFTPSERSLFERMKRRTERRVRALWP
jgi:hypothetical protein